MKRLAVWCVMLTLLMALGCNQDNPAADGDSGKKTDKKETDKNDAAKGSSSDKGSQSDSNGENRTPSGESGSKAVAGDQQTMVMADDFAVLRVDLEGIRTSPLLKGLPKSIDDLILEDADMPPEIAEQVVQIESAWLAVAPGEGKWEDFMFLMGGDARRGEARSEESEFEEQSGPRRERFEDGPSFDESGGFDESGAAGDLNQASYPVALLQDEGEVDPAELDDLFGVTEDSGAAEAPATTPPAEGRLTLDEAFGSTPSEGSPSEVSDEETLVDDPATVEDVAVDDEDFDFGDGPPVPLEEPFEPTELPEQPINVSLWVTFKTDTAAQSLIDQLPPDAKANQHEHAGQTYYAFDGTPVFFRVDGRHLLLTTREAVVKQVIDGKQAAKAPMLDRLAKTNQSAHVVLVGNLEPIRSDLNMLLDELGPARAAVMPALANLSALSLAADLSGKNLIDADLDAKDAAGGEILVELVRGYIKMGQSTMEAELDGAKARGSTAEQIGNMQFVLDMLISLQVNHSGSHIDVTLPRPENLQQTVDELMEQAKASASRLESLNKLKQIGLAMHTYHTAHAEFPTQVFLHNREATQLSWRVAILPFIEHTNLYDQFRHDEPWDSAHNIKLLDQMPAIYRSPMSHADPDHTNYQGVTGEGYFFDGDRRLRIADFRDGTTNTIMVVEVDDDHAVPWTKPADFTPDGEDPAKGLGGLWPEGVFHAVWVDGHVSRTPADIDASTLKAVFTRNGGEVVDSDAVHE